MVAPPSYQPDGPHVSTQHMTPSETTRETPPSTKPGSTMTFTMGPSKTA